MPNGNTLRSGRASVAGQLRAGTLLEIGFVRWTGGGTEGGEKRRMDDGRTRWTWTSTGQDDDTLVGVRYVKVRVRSLCTQTLLDIACLGGAAVRRNHKTTEGGRREEKKKKGLPDSRSVGGADGD